MKAITQSSPLSEAWTRLPFPLKCVFLTSLPNFSNPLSLSLPSYLYPSFNGVVVMEEYLTCQWVPLYRIIYHREFCCWHDFLETCARCQIMMLGGRILPRHYLFSQYTLETFLSARLAAHILAIWAWIGPRLFQWMWAWKFRSSPTILGSYKVQSRKLIVWEETIKGMMNSWKLDVEKCNSYSSNI